MSSSSLVLVHAQPLVLRGLRTHLMRYPEFRIVGEAGNGQQALHLIDYTQPELVLITLDLPGVTGLQVAHAIKRIQPASGIILLGPVSDPVMVVQALRAGSAAYLPANVAWDDLLPVLRAVRNGAYPINDLVLHAPEIAALVLETFRALTGEAAVAPIDAPLVPREIVILEGAARGWTNKQIAGELGIGVQGVKKQLSSILRKLTMNDRTQAVVHAMRRGWIHMPDPEASH